MDIDTPDIPSIQRNDKTAEYRRRDYALRARNIAQRFWRDRPESIIPNIVDDLEKSYREGREDEAMGRARVRRSV